MPVGRAAALLTAPLVKTQSSANAMLPAIPPKIDKREAAMRIHVTQFPGLVCSIAAVV